MARGRRRGADGVGRGRWRTEEMGLGGAALARLHVIRRQKAETAELVIWKTNLSNRHNAVGRFTQRTRDLYGCSIRLVHRAVHGAVREPRLACELRQRPVPASYPFAELHSCTL